MILVSPQPEGHIWDALNCSACPLLVIHSDNDFACSIDQLEKWFDTIREPKERRMLRGGEHFFRGREHEVVSISRAFLAQYGMDVGASP
jgi:dipeptidyl aminopeptidase/acylaminoacyl peptidase